MSPASVVAQRRGPRLIVTAPRDPSSAAYLLAAFEVTDGAPGGDKIGRRHRHRDPR